MKNLYLLVFLLIISCKEETKTLTTNQKAIVAVTTIQQINYDSIREQAINYFLKNKDFFFSKLNKTIGVVTTTKNLTFGDTIKLLNENKVIDSLYIYDDEYQINTFNCISADSLYYKISVDKTNFYLRKSNKIQFEPWEVHVLNVPFIGFNPTNNPIHKNPDSASEITPYSQDEFYSPVQLSGDWMQIIWGDESGWIKWKENNNLIIELFYFA